MRGHCTAVFPNLVEFGQPPHKQMHPGPWVRSLRGRTRIRTLGRWRERSGWCCCHRSGIRPKPSAGGTTHASSRRPPPRLNPPVRDERRRARRSVATVHGGEKSMHVWYVIVRSACFSASRVHVCDSPPPTCHVHVSVAVVSRVSENHHIHRHAVTVERDVQSPRSMTLGDSWRVCSGCNVWPFSKSSSMNSYSDFQSSSIQIPDEIHPAR